MLQPLPQLGIVTGMGNLQVWGHEFCGYGYGSWFWHTMAYCIPIPWYHGYSMMMQWITILYQIRPYLIWIWVRVSEYITSWAAMLTVLATHMCQWPVIVVLGHNTLREQFSNLQKFQGFHVLQYKIGWCSPTATVLIWWWLSKGESPENSVHWVKKMK